MTAEGKYIYKEKFAMEKVTIQFMEALLYDELHTLAAEYSVSVNLLVNLAVKRLIGDVTLFRRLREGKIKEESFYDSSLSK